MPEQVTIEAKGYEPVTCDKPLPCPFCGSFPRLAQLHRTLQGHTILASFKVLAGNQFWFKCPVCWISTRHKNTAQEAVEWWNKRHDWSGT